jgi:hypothetical protein
MSFLCDFSEFAQFLQPARFDLTDLMPPLTRVSALSMTPITNAYKTAAAGRFRSAQTNAALAVKLTPHAAASKCWPPAGRFYSGKIMEDTTELQRITQLIINAMQVSTDPLTAAGAAEIPSLEIGQHKQAVHLARCIAAFTTDDALAIEMAEIVGESPKFLISKVLLVHYAPEKCTGEHAALEIRIWKRLYAGRRERNRVKDVLIRRSVI